MTGWVNDLIGVLLSLPSPGSFEPHRSSAFSDDSQQGNIILKMYDAKVTSRHAL